MEENLEMREKPGGHTASETKQKEYLGRKVSAVTNAKGNNSHQCHLHRDRREPLDLKTTTTSVALKGSLGSWWVQKSSTKRKQTKSSSI